VRQLLAVEPDRRRVILQHNPEWRTAGVVRKVLSAVDDVNYTAPQQAVDLSVLATDIAESLDPTAYAGDTVMKLRATAWRERAYALYYVGSYTESLAALASTFPQAPTPINAVCRRAIIRPPCR